MSEKADKSFLNPRSGHESEDRFIGYLAQQ